MEPGSQCRGYLANSLMGNTVTQDTYYRAHKLSLHQFLYDKSGGLFKSNKVKVHTFLTGRSVMPHTALIQSASGTSCKSELELRSRRFLETLRFPPTNDDAVQSGLIDNRRTDNYDKWLLFVYFSLGLDIIPPNFQDPTRLDATKVLTGVATSWPTATYYYPPPNTYFSTAASLTRGAWHATRPLCPTAPWPGGGPQTPDELCALAPLAAPPVLLGVPFTTEQYVVDMAAVPAGPALIGAGIVDPFGRLMCDPTTLKPVGESLATWSTKVAATSFLSVRPLTLVRQP